MIQCEDRRRMRRGGAAVELAVILPVLVTLILGCIDYGRFAHQRSAVVNSAREAAVVGASHPFTDETLPDWEQSVRKAAIDEMRQVVGFDESKLQLIISHKIDAADLVRIKIEIEYPFYTIIAWPGLPSESTLYHRVVFRSTRP